LYASAPRKPDGKNPEVLVVCDFCEIVDAKSTGEIANSSVVQVVAFAGVIVSLGIFADANVNVQSSTELEEPST
jgi:hypothetical protein